MKKIGHQIAIVAITALAIIIGIPTLADCNFLHVADQNISPTCGGPWGSPCANNNCTSVSYSATCYHCATTRTESRLLLRLPGPPYLYSVTRTDMIGMTCKQTITLGCWPCQGGIAVQSTVYCETCPYSNCP